MDRQPRLDEIKEYLLSQDETTILELLDLTSEMILDRFMDRVRERYSYICRELEILDSSIDEEDIEENERDYDD